MVKTAATRMPAAISTNSPTMACSRFEFIVLLSCHDIHSYGPPVFLGECLQIIELTLYIRLRDPVQKLPHAWLRARSHFFDCADRHDISFINQYHAIRDQKSAGQFMG